MTTAFVCGIEIRIRDNVCPVPTRRLGTGHTESRCGMFVGYKIIP